MDTDNALPQTEAPLEPTTTLTKHPTNRKQAYLLTASIFLLIILALLVFYPFFSNKLGQIMPITQSVSPTPDVTSNWKQYTDTSQAFIFKYPSHYTTDFQDSMGNVFNSNIRLTVGNVPLPSVCMKNCTEESTKKVRLGENEVFVTKSVETAYQTYSQETIHYSIKNPYLHEVITFRLYANAPYERISPTIGSYYKITPSMQQEMEKIIASFKFLGWSSIQDVSILVANKPDMAKWKTFENNELSMMYPPSWKLESSYSPSVGPQDLDHEPSPANAVFITSDNNKVRLTVGENAGGRFNYPFNDVSTKVMWAGYKSHLGYDYLGEGSSTATLRNNEKEIGAIMSLHFKGTDEAKFDNFSLYKDDFLTSANTLKIK